MSIIDTPSLSSEKATEVGLGFGHFALSGMAGWFFSKGISFLGTKTEDYVRTHWKTMWTIISTPEIKLRFPPHTVIPEERVIQAIQTCISSGESAAVSVGIAEALVQCYHLVSKENTKPFSVNLLEGGYRGAAIGFIAGLTKESEHLLEKIIYTATAALVGSVLGQTIAVIGYIARSHLNQNKNETVWHTGAIEQGVLYDS